MLAGSAAAPGGNVELSKFAGPVTTLSGTLGGTAISLRSLTLNDWFVGGNVATPTALTSSYISAAYSATHGGAAISAPDLQAATMSFFGIGGQSPYKFVSDPNVSYVMQDGDEVKSAWPASSTPRPRCRPSSAPASRCRPTPTRAKW